MYNRDYVKLLHTLDTGQWTGCPGLWPLPPSHSLSLLLFSVCPANQNKLILFSQLQRKEKLQGQKERIFFSLSQYICGTKQRNHMPIRVHWFCPFFNWKSNLIPQCFFQFLHYGFKFSWKKWRKVPSKSEQCFVILKVRQYDCPNNQNIVLILGLKEYFRKRTLQKVTAKFFLGTQWFFREIIFEIVFLWGILLNCFLRSEIIIIVSDYVPDILMSSLKTCNVNCGEPLGEGRGRVTGMGRAVYHQPGKSVDKHSHHELQKGISK